MVFDSAQEKSLSLTAREKNRILEVILLYLFLRF